MSDPRFTAGPWKAYGPSVDANGDSDCICDTWESGCAAFEIETCEANARLISAAPDMFEALKALLDAFPSSDVIKAIQPESGLGYRSLTATFSDKDIERFRVALAKAVGQ